MPKIARAVFLALATVSASLTHAAPPDTSCAPPSVAALDALAAQGDFRAQYWRGIQLELGKCDAKDRERANSLFQQSAAQGFPPAVHILGVILQRDGQDGEAIKYFERAAQLGFQLGFVDLGFTYGRRDSPVRDAVLSYAWLTVAMARETKIPLREYLASSRAEVARAMSQSDLIKAKGVAEELSAKFSSVPVWSDSGSGK